ncbi:7tm 6 domain containing protein, partial [Asbolus verrucosus]
MNKKETDKGDVFYYPLKVFWYTGFHPHLTYRWLKLLWFINLSIMTFMVALAVKGIFYSFGKDLYFTVECIETCILIFHVIVKHVILIFYKNTMAKLLEKRNQFWKINDFDGDIHKKCTRIAHIGQTLNRYYFLLCMMCVFGFYLQPFITGQTALVVYEPEGWHDFINFLVWYMGYFMYGSAVATDGFMCSIGTSLTVQFNLLSHQFKTVKLSIIEEHDVKEKKKLWDTLKKLVKHHNFLLGICDAVYESKWYEINNDRFKRCLTIVMVKAQNELVFSGFGLVWINLRTFVLVKNISRFVDANYRLIIYKETDKDDVFYYPLKVFWYTGFHPLLQSPWLKLLWLVNLSIMTFMVALAVKGFFVSFGKDLYFTVECIETSILMTHVIVKHIILVFHRSTMAKLLENRKKFWEIRNFHGDISKKCTRLAYIGQTLNRYYFLLCMMCVLGFYLQPFVTGQTVLVVYEPEGWHNVINCLTWYIGFFMYGSAVATDGFMCSIGISLVIQFKLLSHRFKTVQLSVEECNDMKKEMEMWNVQKNLVKQHNFLLSDIEIVFYSYCKDVNYLFSGVFLLVFLVSIASASAYSICDAEYELKWYKTNNLQFTRCLTIVMAKAQNELVFSGFGLVWVNLRTFVL